MKHLAKSIAKRALGTSGWIDHPTPQAQVAAVIRKLKPLSSDRGLCRYGPEGDGGYLMPNDLEGVTACISPGVSTECGFDLAMAEQGIDVFMADASVAGPPVDHPKFHFEKIFLDAYPGANTTTIDRVCDSIAGRPAEGDFILQMDIEGAEYRVIPSMSEDLLKRFRIIIVEMHNLDQLFAAFAFEIIKATFEKITLHHHVVHIHPNNCCGSVSRYGLEIPRVMEFTLYRKDRATFSDREKLEFPHPLDVDVKASNRPLILPACWQ